MVVLSVTLDVKTNFHKLSRGEMSGGVQICFYFHHFPVLCTPPEWSSLFSNASLFCSHSVSFLLLSFCAFVVCLPCTFSSVFLIWEVL